MKPTLPYFFETSVKAYPDNVYLWEKTGEKYEGTTYLETREKVYRFAAGLISLDARKGDRIALLSEGRNNWVIGELGIVYAGAINVPLSVKLNEPGELCFRLVHSGCRMILVSARQVSKIRRIRSDLPELKKIIILDDVDPEGPDEITFREVLRMGDEFLASFPEIFIQTWKSVEPDDPANVCYTSGTTADPKGIILTHRNYISNIEQGYSLMDIYPHYRTLLILPWDHAFAHTAGIYCFMGKGASIGSVQQGMTPLENLRNLSQNIRELKPVMMMSVPALAASFRKNIEKGIREKGKITGILFRHALRISYRYIGDGRQKGKGMTWLYLPLIFLYDQVIFRKIRAGFGGKMEFFIGGGALLDIEYQKFFYAIGIPMFQGYGLTEAAPIISSNSLKKHKLGSSGYLVRDLELKICDENGKALSAGEKGEIVVRGENVMKGYWKNNEATSEAIRDGWLHTGDMGYMDPEGFLYVLGRFKSLLIADDGEKFSPEGMEETFAGQSLFIDQCMLYNNQCPYTVILVVPNKESLRKWVEERGLDIRSEEGIKACLEEIASGFREYRSGGRHAGSFPQRWLPAATGILSEGFTEENRLMNSTMKMVRDRIVEKHRDLIDFLYTPEAKEIVNQKNKEAIRQLFE
jgi:long-chain acyl-CoA synthetase